MTTFFLYAYIAECVAKRTHLKRSTSAGMGNFEFTKCYKRVFFGGGNVFSTSLTRPADPGKTEKGKLIV